MSRTCVRDGWKGWGGGARVEWRIRPPNIPICPPPSWEHHRDTCRDGRRRHPCASPPRNGDQHVPKLGVLYPNWGTQRTPTGDAAAAQDGRQQKRSPLRPPRRGDICRAGAVTHLLMKSHHPSSSPGRATVGSREHDGKRWSGK